MPSSLIMGSKDHRYQWMARVRDVAERNYVAQLFRKPFPSFPLFSSCNASLSSNSRVFADIRQGVVLQYVMASKATVGQEEYSEVLPLLSSTARTTPTKELV